MSDLMDRIDREIRERREKVHLWSTDDGYLCGPCYREWLPKEAAKQHAAEPDDCDDDGDFAEEIDQMQVGRLKEGDLWEFTFPISCEKCGREVVTIVTSYRFPIEEDEDLGQVLGRSAETQEALS